MKEITEDYVSFETRKLLLKKGMPKDCFNHLARENTQEDTTRTYYTCSLHKAIKWLREEHHYYIQVMLDTFIGCHCGYYVVIMKTDSDFELALYDEVEQVFYETPEEACEAAIKYVLENLI